METRVYSTPLSIYVLGFQRSPEKVVTQKKIRGGAPNPAAREMETL